MIRFIHISDSHLGPDKNFIQRDINSYQAFQAFLRTAKELPFKPDFIVHTGDVTSDCQPEGYKLMASMIETLEIPIYFVTGNHDTSALIKSNLHMKNIEILSEKLNSYKFSHGEHNFLTVDGRGANEIDPHGVISVEQFQIVENELKSDNKLSIFVHFPTLALDSPWFDKNMRLTNGEDFHDFLVAHRDQVRGVFFGHVHRTSQMFRDGILYSSVGSTSVQFVLNPVQKEPVFEKNSRGSYNVVTMDSESLIIKECSFENTTSIQSNT